MNTCIESNICHNLNNPVGFIAVLHVLHVKCKNAIDDWYLFVSFSNSFSFIYNNILYLSWLYLYLK